MDLLQKVQIGQTKVGQKVKFLNKKAWWSVVKRDSNKNETIIKRGSSYWHLSNECTVLQNLFENINS
ncbi:MAG: hypothetical protein HS119_11355 [Flavobacteriales bacterium]|nr:hypothetical protein [Flavobacteriales bacterium]